MTCPVHGAGAGCKCGYAVRWAAYSFTTLLIGAALGSALASCGPRPDVCSEKDATLLVNEASCLTQVKARCAGVPLDEPCPFEEECKTFTRERCK